MQWLRDKVYTICDATANLKQLAEEFVLEWAMQHIVPKVVFPSFGERYLPFVLFEFVRKEAESMTLEP